MGSSVFSGNSYPLQEWEKQEMGKDSFALTDFPFPREDLEPSENYYPPSAEPPEDFEDQVGAGGRLPILASREPQKLLKRMKKQDRDRYEYTKKQLKISHQISLDYTPVQRTECSTCYIIKWRTGHGKWIH